MCPHATGLLRASSVPASQRDSGQTAIAQCWRAQETLTKHADEIKLRLSIHEEQPNMNLALVLAEGTQTKIKGLIGSLRSLTDMSVTLVVLPGLSFCR